MEACKKVSPTKKIVKKQKKESANNESDTIQKDRQVGKLKKVKEEQSINKEVSTTVSRERRPDFSHTVYENHANNQRFGDHRAVRPRLSQTLPTQMSSSFLSQPYVPVSKKISTVISSRTVVNADGTHSTSEPVVTQSKVSDTEGAVRDAESISESIPHGRENLFLDEVNEESDMEEDGEQGSDNEAYTRSSSITRHTHRGKYDHTPEYWDCGDASYRCPHCDAMLWYGERTNKSRNVRSPVFTLCCNKGKIKLPPLQEPPQLLQRLFDYLGDERSTMFREKIKVINALFAFTSTGGRICNYLNDGSGPYVYCISGQNHHRIGSLMPEGDNPPRYAQMYLYDGDDEVEVRLNALSRDGRLDAAYEEMVQELIDMFNECNPYVKTFRMVRERYRNDSLRPLRLRLIGARSSDGRQHNLPTASEVAAIIPGDGQSNDNRDVVLELRGGGLRRINELHPSFMALQYPLLFPYGEDGFRLDIPLNVPNRSKGRKCVTMREFYAYRHFQRFDHANTLQKAGRLYQTYSVDSYSGVEENNLRYVRLNQKRLRCDVYNGVRDRLLAGDVDKEDLGKRYILPSSFVGSPRYMVQNYQDAMAICRWAGPPDLFVTMTCNPKWPEIQRKSDKIPGQKAVDRHEDTDRIFKQKLEELMRDFKERSFFGRLKAAIYTIEFQKRGLPHAHILLFLHPEDKICTPDDIDEVISAELPSSLTDPAAFEAVRQHMIHGPCGVFNKKAPCMIGDKCDKGYEMKFCDQTHISQDGWPVYRRRNNGRTATVRRDNIVVDNRWVVPHNVHLLLKYNCHINVEWCNQGTLVKYLFKYLNKGHDRATVVIGEEANTPSDIRDLARVQDEIKHYQECRYISAAEACWRLFGFPTQYRSIGVERLCFHLEGENMMWWEDEDTVDDLLDRTTAAMSQFTEWFEANKKYLLAKTLTYEQFPSYFTWHGAKSKLYWRPRKGTETVIGRIYYVPPATGELFYLRRLLNVVKGPESFEDIRTVDGVVYQTYKDACVARRMLDNDDEWHKSLQDYAQWKTGYQLRELFCQILCFAFPTNPFCPVS